MSERLGLPSHIIQKGGPCKILVSPLPPKVAEAIWVEFTALDCGTPGFSLSFHSLLTTELLEKTPELSQITRFPSVSREL